jgi:Tol biopolymer transport system component
VFDLATGTQRDLTDDHFTGPMLNLSKQGMPVYIDSTPTWSPAGDALYFARTAIVGGTITPRTAIYRIPAAGGTPRLVVDAAPHKAFALWYGMALAASDTRIVYTLDYMTPGDTGTGLYVAGLPGTAVRQVVAGDRQFGAPFLLGLTPDGNSAVVWYAEGAGDPTTPPRANLVFVANLKTGALQPITPTQVPASSSQTGVVLSSDGTKLLYVYRSSSGHSTVVIKTLRTGAETT